MTPLIALDIWEHAYYLQYKDNRQEYLEAILKVINWEEIENKYQNYLKANNINKNES